MSSVMKTKEPVVCGECKTRRSNGFFYLGDGAFICKECDARMRVPDQQEGTLSHEEAVQLARDFLAKLKAGRK